LASQLKDPLIRGWMWMRDSTSSRSMAAVKPIWMPVFELASAAVSSGASMNGASPSTADASPNGMLREKSAIA
jgi:hypothetical protein